MIAKLRDTVSGRRTDRAKPPHPGPSVNLAIGAALVGVIIALVLFFVYRPAPGITFGLVIIAGAGAVMLALGTSLTRQWLRNR